MSNLLFDGVDVVALSENHPTPFYLYSKKMIKDRLEIVENVFLNQYPNTDAFYASKAFLCLEMARIIKDSKLGIDVASMGEMFIALKAGISPDKILMHGNNKSSSELLYALEHKIGRIVVDNLVELKLINTLSTKYNLEVNILIRFSPKLNEVHTHKFIQTGHKTSKFGFDLDNDLDEIFKIVNSNDLIHFLGIHFHVGSQLNTFKNHLEATSIVFKYIKLMKDEYHYITEELNIGGGYGIQYLDTDTKLPLEGFVKPVMNLINDLSVRIDIKRPKVVIEPGRSIVGECAITVYEVGYTKKKTNEKEFLAINGGMTDNLRVALYNGKYSCDIANKMNVLKNHSYDIVGNACESTDLMIKDALLPKVARGDLLVVYNTGAYEHSLANNFNKMLRPEVLLIDGSVKTIQRRETLSDLIRRDL